ncbi:hypothetical protein F5I97DRAFT_1805330 [Phlebopus sp. FC_14]|nr:hypothetical protein F5I97DRAFT_1805330 [Phlebopus sp. FC_14]
MRIKISTNPPLPPLKAWFPIASKADPGSSLPQTEPEPTVQTLKRKLCASIPALRPFSPSAFRLLIDEYELLDECELSVIRDGDLVLIERIRVPQNTTKRDEANANRESRELKAAFDAVARKAGTLPANIPSRKRKRRGSISSTSSESESSTSSSSSSASSSGSSESDSELTDLDSDSDSESESESESEPSPSRTTPSSASFVPPGFGKPQTRARNLRKRIKRQHEREAAASTEGRASGANATALDGVDNPPEEHEAQSVSWDAPATNSYTSADVAALPSLSLRNKNKAKNFRALMNKPLPPKIIFSDLENEASTSATPIPQIPQAPESSASVQRTLPPLVPPSSRPSLPTNLFVTSIDVEAGLRRSKKKQKNDRNGDVLLDYGDEADPGSKQDEDSTAKTYASELDPEALELFANQNWSDLPRITEEQAIPNRIVAYKVLGINPTTFTPEYLLTLAEVVALKVDLTDKKLVVRPLRPPSQISFSGPWGGDDQGGDEEAEEHAWEDVLRDWRIVER